METFSGDFGFILKSSKKKFSFLLKKFSSLQFLTYGDFVGLLGLLKSSKDFENYDNLEMFLINEWEPDWLKWKPLQLKACVRYFL